MCTNRSPERCPDHGALCVEPGRLFAVDADTVFDWEAALATGDRFVFMLEVAPSGAEAYSALVIFGEAGGGILRTVRFDTEWEAEWEAWLELHEDGWGVRAPSVSGFVPSEDHAGCVGSNLTLGRTHNVLGLYVCRSCRWSEVGPVTDDFKYALQQPWPDDALTLVIDRTRRGLGYEFRAVYVDEHVGNGDTVEDAEHDAFVRYLDMV